MNKKKELFPSKNNYLRLNKKFSLRQQYIASLRQSFDRWFSQWFCTKIGAISDWPNQKETNIPESLLLKTNHTPLLEMRYSVPTLLGMCGQQDSYASRHAAALFAENALKDLLAKVSFCREHVVVPRQQTSYQQLSSSAVFTVATSEGVVEIIFYSELYSHYLQSLLTDGKSCDVISLFSSAKLP